MQLTSQNLIVLALVALAVAYLARKAWLSMSRKKVAGCGSCGSCPQAVESPGLEIVEIGRLTEPATTLSAAVAKPTAQTR